MDENLSNSIDLFLKTYDEKLNLKICEGKLDLFDRYKHGNNKILQIYVLFLEDFMRNISDCLPSDFFEKFKRSSKIVKCFLFGDGPFMSVYSYLLEETIVSYTDIKTSRELFSRFLTSNWDKFSSV